MRIRSIIFAHEITDLYVDNVDVFVESESGYTYLIVVGTPGDLLDEMKQEKTNFIKPHSPIIVVKKLTQEIIEEALLFYAKDDAYWLKLCQFGHRIDISVFNELEAAYLEEWELFDLEGLERFFYYIQKYTKVSPKNRVLLEPMLFLILSSSVAYSVLKLGLGFLDFFSNFIRSN